MYGLLRNITLRRLKRRPGACYEGEELEEQYGFNRET